MAKVHFRLLADIGPAHGCGLYGSNYEATSAPGDVTCGACKRSIPFQTAQIKLQRTA